MATIVNTPSSGGDGSGTGMMVGVVVVVIMLILLFVYGLPMLRQSSAPQVNIPDKVNIDVNSGGSGQQ